ncbi:MAG: helix-turn-helix transcriptional regulator [Gammaproteobacteria bacterium]|nr:helix-turn-helix transcriptional regulator [Gammaproteobacteria bacterium]
MKSSPPSDVFPNRLRIMRRKRNLSQGALAKRTGLQGSAISHFETGARKPSFDNLRRLADALDATTDYLLGRVTDTQAIASADKLYRHMDQLTSEDQDMVEDFLEILVRKSKKRKSDNET